MADDGTFASDFVQAITDEIERFTQALSPAATTYRGAELRYALQRALYFDLVNDAACRRAWLAARGRSGWLARHLPSWPRAFADAAVRAAPRLARDLRRVRADAAPSRPLVVGVTHAKLLRYVKPLLGDDARVYCGLDEPLRRSLAEAGVATLRAPVGVPWRRALDARQPRLAYFGLPRQLDAHLAMLAATRPRAVLVVEGNAPFDEVLNQACKLAGVPCVCIQQGWSPIIHTGFRHLSYDVMFVWGDAFAGLLARHSPAQRFVATGSHVVTRAAAAAGPRDAVSFFLQGISPMIDAAAWHGFLGLVERVAKAQSSAPILVREHPSVPLDEATRHALRALPGVELIDPAQLPLGQQMARSRVGVSLFSTTLFECVPCGVVPVAVNPGILREVVPSLAQSGAGLEVGSFAEAETAILRLCRDADFLAQLVSRQPAFNQQFFNGADADAARQALRTALAALEPSLRRRRGRGPGGL